MRVTCFVVGEGALLVECVNVLIQAHFEVKGVVSPDPRLQAQLEAGGVRFIERKPGWTQVLRQEPFDYLFSIVNDTVLSADILSLPRRLSINYHDGPLPAYAGVHATFWALVNGEKSHGVTWHAMRPQVDAGDILNQTIFHLSENETSLSLNTRCFATALDSFRELVGALLTDEVIPQPQDQTRRSYYARNQRPDLRLNGQRPAAQLAALSRALQFGFHPNPFGLLKLWIHDAVFLVQEANISQRTTRYPPGTVETIDLQNIAIATADGVLTLRGILTPEGEPVVVAALAERFGLRPGVSLKSPADDETERWQHRVIRCASHQAYWMDNLTRFQPTMLETGGPLPSGGFQGKVEFLEIELPSALSALVVESPLSSSELALATFLVYLSRASGDAHPGVGFGSDALRRAANESGGLLADRVPFSVDVDLNADFGEACRRVRQELDRVGERDTFARERLVTQPALHAFAERFRRDGFPIDIQLGNESPRQMSAVPPSGLMLVLPDSGSGQFVFNPARWDALRVADLAQRWTLLVENLSRQPAQRLAEIDLLSAEERHRLLHVWGSAPVPYPREALVHRLIEEQVTRRPGAVALRCGPTTLTYDDLNRRANALAWLLRKRGVCPDATVGVCLDRSPELVVSLLAILKAGGAYVPLDPSYPPTRLATLQGLAGIRLVVTTASLVNRLAETSATGLILEHLAVELGRESVENLPSDTQAEHLAYVLFTSGSSGQPKAVAVPHRGVVRLVNGANFARLDEATVLLGMAPLAFDASTLEIWGSLANGGQLVLLPEVRPSLDGIKETIQEHRVTTAFFTSALFNVLVDSGISDLISLRDVLTGGDVVSPTHVARAYQQLPDCRFINGYGPTESTTFASFYPIPPGDPLAPTVPIGSPVSNTQLFILDTRQRLVPPGAVGELCIGGDGLARSYLGEPELTARKFIRHPFSLYPSDRLYRTGDQARFRPDGCLEFLGRMDDQVKIRGFRIEPGEIETALCQHPDVREAVVVAREAVPGDKRLVAYLIFRPQSVPDVVSLRTFLQNRLPEHLIPAAWVPLETMPMTPNGKVDKKRLPRPVFSSDRKATATPLSENEQLLQTIWMDLLRIGSVSADDSFFDLGGDSLLAIQLLARIHRQWGVRPAVKDVFAHPTLRQFSAFLDDVPTEAGTTENALSAPGMAAEAPLSFAQQRLWVLHQLHELGGTYNVPLVLRITGPLNLPVLQRSLEALVQRHQALRTTFSYTDGRLFQRVGAAFPLPIPVIELPDSDVNSAKTERWLSEEGHRPFDLEHTPLLRVRAARLGAHDHVLLLVFHHLIFDGWSVRVLASELSALYNHARRGQNAPLPDLSMQYPDYARWQAEQQAPTALATALSYWGNQLRGAPPLLALPTDYPRPKVQPFAGDDVAFTLPPATWEALTRLVVPNTTPFMRLLAATAVWLGRQASTDDVVIGVPIAGRTRAEANALIGFFVNTLVIRVELSGNLTFRQLLQRVRQRALEAYEHQELPFDQLVGALNPPRTLAYLPVVQVVVDLVEEDTAPWQLDGAHTEQLPFRQHTAKFDLNVSFRQTKRGMEGVFNYKSDLFKRETVVRWSEEFIQLVEELAREPDRSLTPGTASSAEQADSLANTPENADTAREEALIPPTTTPDVTSVLAALRALWIRVLGLDAVGLNDNFFDLGGHSLLAFQLGAEWQRQTGQKLPLSLLFAHPTLSQLAEQVTRLPHTSPELLVPIRPQGTGNALFFVHDVSGDVDYARHLAPYLTDGQPVFGLEAPGLHGETVPVPTIEEMAAQHLKRVVAHQPQGPYALAGYSLGGIIAFEMARQLRQAGQQIQLLVLLDCYPLTPRQSSLKRVPLRYVLRNYWNFWRTMPKRPTALGTVVRKKVPALVRYLGNRARYFIKPAPPLSIEEQIGPGMAAFYEVNPLVEAHIDAYNRYVFRPCDVKAIFVRATGELVYGNLTKHLKKFDFGWSRYARGGVEVHEMPGTHASLFNDPEALSLMGALFKRSRKNPYGNQ